MTTDIFNSALALLESLSKPHSFGCQDFDFTEFVNNGFEGLTVQNKAGHINTFIFNGSNTFFIGSYKTMNQANKATDKAMLIYDALSNQMRKIIG